MNESKEQPTPTNNSTKPNKPPSNFGPFISLGVVLAVVLALLCTASYKIATEERISRQLQTHCTTGFCLSVDMRQSSPIQITFEFLTNHIKDLVSIGVQTIIIKNLALNSIITGNTEKDIKLFTRNMRSNGIGFFVEIRLDQVNYINDFIKIGAHGFVVDYNAATFSTVAMETLHNSIKILKKPVQGKLMLKFQNKNTLNQISADWKTITSKADIVLIPFDALKEGNLHPSPEFYSSNTIIYTSDTITTPTNLYSILVSSFYYEGVMIYQSDLFINSPTGIVINRIVADELQRKHHLKKRLRSYKSMDKPSLEKLPSNGGSGPDEFYMVRKNKENRKPKYSSFIIIYSSYKRQLNLQDKYGEFGELLYQYPITNKPPLKVQIVPMGNIILEAGSILMIGVKVAP